MDALGALECGAPLGTNFKRSAQPRATGGSKVRAYTFGPRAECEQSASRLSVATREQCSPVGCRLLLANLQDSKGTKEDEKR